MIYKLKYILKIKNRLLNFRQLLKIMLIIKKILIKSLLLLRFMNALKILLHRNIYHKIIYGNAKNVKKNKQQKK